MTDLTKPKLSRRSKAGATAAGAGAGTVLAAIANGLSVNNPLKQWLVLCAPSVSVFLGILWLWASTKVLNYFYERDFMANLRRTKDLLMEALNNSNTTQTHKNVLRKELEQLELLALKRHKQRLASIRVITEDDMQPAEA